jgi:hypothetical protein
VVEILLEKIVKLAIRSITPLYMYNNHTYIIYCLPGIPGKLSVFLSFGN